MAGLACTPSLVWPLTSNASPAVPEKVWRETSCSSVAFCKCCEKLPAERPPFTGEEIRTTCSNEFLASTLPRRLLSGESCRLLQAGGAAARSLCNKGDSSAQPGLSPCYKGNPEQTDFHFIVSGPLATRLLERSTQAFRTSVLSMTPL
eukprot:2678563-Amphidinium_carterae.2